MADFSPGDLVKIYSPPHKARKGGKKRAPKYVVVCRPDPGDESKFWGWDSDGAKTGSSAFVVTRKIDRCGNNWYDILLEERMVRIRETNLKRLFENEAAIA